MNRIRSFDSDKAILYLVATPIGNLLDMTYRAVAILKEVDKIYAEDTRNSIVLLKHYEINTKLESYHEFNQEIKTDSIIEELKSGMKIAIISDAGLPVISDPGYRIAKEAIKNDIAVSTISGSSAFINALVASGLETKHFYFYGFLPAKENEAKEEISSFKDKKETIILYEAPHRIMKTLKLLRDGLGNRYVCLARELTKLNEEYIRGTLDELLEIDEATIKGEIVLIIEGNKNEATIDDEQIKARVAYFVNLGLSQKDAIQVTSEVFKINKNYVKKLVF